jgi:pyruvate dehydrogenase E1 component alpha subunit
MALGPNKLIEMLHTMKTIRRFEERASDDYHRGKIYGVVHCYIGEEAIATGVCAALRDSDQIISTHRGHGHCIAKGADLDRMMAELYGRRDGYCKGKGGSMHIADFQKGMLGANGIVAGGMSIVTGAALAAKMLGTGGVAVSFFGDGASAAGPFHECLNIATAWKLPVIFVCENNQYAAQTPAATTIARDGEIVHRAAGYGIPGLAVDGNDVHAVYEAAEKAVGRARAGEGPTLIEARTYRWRAHTERTGQADYRPKSEIETWMAPDRDPIARLAKDLKQHHGFTDAAFAEMDRQVLERIEAACRFAEQSPFPAPDEALDDVFAA